MDRVQIFGRVVFCYFLWLRVVTLLDLPFNDKNLGDMFKMVTTIGIEFPEHFSKKLKDFITKVLNKNPLKRLSFERMVDDPWICELSEDVLMSLKKEVQSFGIKNAAIVHTDTGTIKFTELTTFFLGNLIFRTIKDNKNSNIENFTTRLSFELLIEMFKKIFEEEITKEIEVIQKGIVSVVT